MIVQDVYIHKYDWCVRTFFNVQRYDEILSESLEDVGCNNSEEVIENVLSELNTGFIYSSPVHRSSVILIGEASSPSQFQNTFDHEKGHLATHIAEVNGIDLLGEEFQHLTGLIGQLLYFGAKEYICEC